MPLPNRRVEITLAWCVVHLALDALVAGRQTVRGSPVYCGDGLHGTEEAPVVGGIYVPESIGDGVFHVRGLIR